MLLVLLPEHPHLFGSVGVGSELVLLPRVEEVEAGEDALIFLVVLVNLQDFLGRLFGDVVAVLALHEVLAQLVDQPVEVLIGDVLHVDPLDLEVALELAVHVFPPEGEGLLVVAGDEPGHALEMPTLNCTEEQIGVDFVLQGVTPVLL